MEEETVPEILRVSLTSTMLTLKSMGINDVMNFEFMERPDPEQIRSALK